MSGWKTRFENLLLFFAGALLVTLVFIVVLGVVFRKFGHSLVWYDELASVLLVWLTYTGAAAAASQRAHLGFDGIIKRLPSNFCAFLFVVSEIVVIAFFLLVAIYGMKVQAALQGETLVSLPWLPLSVSQGIIPVAAILFILAELLSIPSALRALS